MKKIKFKNIDTIFEVIKEVYEPETRKVLHFDNVNGAHFKEEKIMSHFIQYKNPVSGIIWTTSASKKIDYEIIEEQK